jgi:hypothetical protein
MTLLLGWGARTILARAFSVVNVQWTRAPVALRCRSQAEISDTGRWRARAVERVHGIEALAETGIRNLDLGVCGKAWSLGRRVMSY